MKKALIFLSLVFALGSCASNTIKPTKPITPEDFKNATAMITDKGNTSGGTGVVVGSFKNKSFILTNSHVCGVVENGGHVIINKVQYTVERYAKSKVHDLCLIEIMTNLNLQTPIATESAKFGDKVTISGHPMLMPTQIVNGLMSEPMEITIIVGIVPCTKEDLSNPDPTVQMICMFLGGFPVVKTYPTMTTSALISPGNSGSAVYNEKGEITALVFAGNGGDLTQGILVPLEYIRNFLYNEKKNWANANSAQRVKLPEQSMESKTTKSTTVPNIKKIKVPAIKDDNMQDLSNKLRQIKTK
jgi:S1-C subfamily serine protease